MKTNVHREEVGITLRAFGTALASPVGYAVLAVILPTGYLGLRYVTTVFSGLDAQVGTTAAIASAVTVLWAAIIAEGIKTAGRTVREVGGATKRARLFDPALVACVRQAEAELNQLAPALTLQAQGDVIDALAEYRTGSCRLGKLIGTMRRDLGRGDVPRGLSGAHDLLRPVGETSSFRA